MTEPACKFCGAVNLADGRCLICGADQSRPATPDDLVASPLTEAVERFFIDHGMIHDRKTGKHVDTQPVEYDEGKFDLTPINEACALLNELNEAARTEPATPDDLVATLLAAVKPLDDLPPSIQSIPNLRIIEAAHKAADRLSSYERTIEGLEQQLKVRGEALNYAKSYLSGLRETGALAEIQAIERKALSTTEGSDR